jgi:hypothetical protein
MAFPASTRHPRGFVPCLALVTLAALAGEAMAQTNLRSTFPGRRIGGGTRGECTSRVLAHLVPASSVFAPGASRTLGVLEGPSASPVPLLVEFRPLSGAGTIEGARAAGQRRTLPASSAGVTLFSLPGLKTPTVWESSYRCGEEAPATAGSDPLNFVTIEAPPALSLLVVDGTKDDKAIQATLQKLRASCGASVARADVAAGFGLADVVTAEWPVRIPVRCPN